jgi:transcriptional regulator with XRE-family HTH domain
VVDEGVAAGAREDGDEGGLFPQTVGERLRATRIAAGLDLNDIAAKTRVPMRHLEAIERGDYSALPSMTYAIGFARSFARAIGADETAIARDLRVELGRTPVEDSTYIPYEPVDPARVPSRLLAWTAAALAVVLLVGYLVWRADWLGGDAAPIPPAPVEAAPAPVASPPVAAAPSPTGQVVLTATAPVWLRIYDKADKVLLQKEMAAGETFNVPLDADTPMIRTGRPEVLKVTIDGQEVPALGPPEMMIRDVGIDAKTLTARTAPTATATPPSSAPSTPTRSSSTPSAPVRSAPIPSAPTTFTPLRPDGTTPVATPAPSGDNAN